MKHRDERAPATLTALAPAIASALAPTTAPAPVPTLGFGLKDFPRMESRSLGEQHGF
jgi:hypothetical protein